MEDTKPTKQEVFDALLEAYQGSETTVIHEYSGNFDRDEKALDLEIKDWEELYKRAR